MRLPFSLLLSLLSLNNRIDSAPVNFPGHQLDKFHEYPSFDYDFTFEVPLATTPLELDVDTEAFRATRIRLLESIVHADSEEELEHANQRYPEVRSKRPLSRDQEDHQSTSRNPEKRQRE